MKVEISEKKHIFGENDIIYTLINDNGMIVKLLNYGAVITEIHTKDKNGVLENVVLTFEDYNLYKKSRVYFGGTLGRTAGRIKNGEFKINGVTYFPSKNYMNNSGHGGFKGFTFHYFEGKVVEEANQVRVIFYRLSPDMEENYPGNLEVYVEYILNNENELIINYKAKSDKKTICNLTNHSYFNLSGNYKRKVTEQVLKLEADYILETDNEQVPNGNKIAIKDTPFDFNEPKLIGKDIEAEMVQRLTSGYDHTYLLKGNKKIEMVDFESGRRLEVETTYPACVIYSTNFPSPFRLYNHIKGEKYSGMCFECQYEPNGINHPDTLNTAILEANETYKETIKYKFTII